MAQLVKSVYKNPGFGPLHVIKTGVVIYTYYHSIQENQKFKDILGYQVSSRLAWDTLNCLKHKEMRVKIGSSQPFPSFCSLL